MTLTLRRERTRGVILAAALDVSSLQSSVEEAQRDLSQVRATATARVIARASVRVKVTARIEAALVVAACSAALRRLSATCPG